MIKVTTVRAFAALACTAAIVVACGSSGGSIFAGPAFDAGGGNGGDDQPGTFGGGADGGGPVGPTGCKPKTCADVGANCGPIGDGCGNVIQCGAGGGADGGGDCPVGETCGGGGTPSVCGAPACTKLTCTNRGPGEPAIECGAAGDGCGGLIASCGTCDAGICGGGGPSKCGAGVDGGSDDGGTCVPTKTACGPGDCGPIADGCGGLLMCPTTCPAGQTCGGGGTASVCGAPPCTKKTCGTQNCGFIGDGCGGLVDCWGTPAICPPGQTCGGAGTANTCGTSPTCTGLCLQQQSCAGGGTTSIEGYVTSPNGVLPVPNAVVYVPNGTVNPFTAGVQCETCSTASGTPLVSTTTDANGHFLLPNMPVSTAGKTVNIPVVVQLGHWRKQITIQTTACANVLVPAVDPSAPTKFVAGATRPTVDALSAALPRNQGEGDIPLTAISTGQVDGLECVFRKMGIDDKEFVDSSGKTPDGTVTNGRIRLYQDDGNGNGGSAGGAIIRSSSAQASTLYTPCAKCAGGSKKNRTCLVNGDCPGSTCNTACTNEIDKYDAVIFGCTGAEDDKSSFARTNVLDYANKGGRVFATHYSYVWLFQTTGWSSTANAYDPNDEVDWSSLDAPGSISAVIDTSFPKGLLFATWLQAPVAPFSPTFAPPYSALGALYATTPPTVALTEARADIKVATANASTSGIVSPAQRWMYTTGDTGAACTAGTTCQSGVCTANQCAGSTVFDTADDPASVNAPMHYTFNTDTTKPAASQCGRVLYSDFHVSIGNTYDDVFPAECSSDPLTSQEKVLAYFLFDLASCVSTTTPPPCKAKSCGDQGIGCGPAGDGCGNPIDCGMCPAGETCGGGGVPSECGAPPCTKLTCQAGQCGKLGDGCGGTLDCGTCAVGTTCGGGGTANVCGTGTCTPSACPAPAEGSACGPVANGCGGVNNCPCPANTPCVNGTCGTPPCTPRTCAQAGANCGQIADGCGGIQDCGMCIAPQTCGGGGTANLCGGGVN